MVVNPKMVSAIATIWLPRPGNVFSNAAMVRGAAVSQPAGKVRSESRTNGAHASGMTPAVKITSAVSEHTTIVSMNVPSIAITP